MAHKGSYLTGHLILYQAPAKNKEKDSLIKFKEEDTNLPYNERSFDVGSDPEKQFGFEFYEERDVAALCSVLRVLKPTGKLMIVAFESMVYDN